MKYDTMGERIFHVGNYIFLALISLMFVIPLVMIFSTSLISEEESLRRGAAYVLYPHSLDFSAYEMLFQRGCVVVDSYLVTLFRVIVGTLFNMAATATFAYALARRTLPGRNLITTFVFFTIIFSGGLIPNYMLMTALHLKDTLWVLIFPTLIITWNLLILRNFFMAVPEELEESAIIDGAKAPTILIRIILPLSLPSIATISMFYAVFHWNEWFQASIYINDVEKMPIQVIMRNLIQQGSMDQMTDESIMDSTMALPPPETLKSAMVVISTLPILAVYPFIQKYFVKGALAGSLKG